MLVYVSAGVLSILGQKLGWSLLLMPAHTSTATSFHKSMACWDRRPALPPPASLGLWGQELSQSSHLNRKYFTHWIISPDPYFILTHTPSHICAAVCVCVCMLCFFCLFCLGTEPRTLDMLGKLSVRNTRVSLKGEVVSKMSRVLLEVRGVFLFISWATIQIFSPVFCNSNTKKYVSCKGSVSGELLYYR